MKTFFKIAFFLLNFTFINAQCNSITDVQYGQIEFDGHSLSSIRDTRGNSNLVNNLMNIAFSATSEIEPISWVKYSSSSLDLYFDEGRQDFQLNGSLSYVYDLTIITVKTSSIPVRFNGSTIYVGDNLQVLGNNLNNIVTYNDGRRSACYKIGSETLAFFISPNNLITSIQYQYYN